MSKLTGNLKWIIIGLTLLLVGFIVYNSFIRKDQKQIEEVVVGSANKDTQEILSLLQKIEKIKLDNSFFIAENKGEGYTLTFNELEDFSKELEKKRPGKYNPFIRGAGITSQEVITNGVDDTQQQDTMTTEEPRVQETPDTE